MNNKRAMYMLVVFSVMFLTLIGYITFIEISYTEKYTTAESNKARIDQYNNEIVRGTIYDRNMTKLAYSEKSDDKMSRIYPYNNMYSHVIGRIAGQNSNGDVHSEFSLLEKEYNSYLMGNDSISKLKNISKVLSMEQKEGNDIILTIDHELQSVAYEAMSGYAGAIVAMNPKTGEILAMVSKPDYNPNLENYLSDYKKIVKSNKGNYVTRATDGLYPPGSTFKIITSASILENDLEDTKYNDTNGEFRIKSLDGKKSNDYVCKNDSGHIYYLTDLNKAFIKSSNVYYTYMGAEKLSADELQKTASDFKFNEKIEFDIPIKASNFQTGNMSKADKANSSIGQGKTTATPLHLALIASTIANDGIMPKPHLVSEIKSGSSTIESLSSDNFGQVIPKEDAIRIKNLMREVVISGTGRGADIPNIEVCGKTGTSENEVTSKGNKYSDKTHSLFVCFAPYDDPQIAIAVVAEYAGFGAQHAVPISKKVLQKFFENNVQ